MVRKIVAREIVADLRSGMGMYEIMSKYDLSTTDFQSILRQVEQERKARAAAIAEDVKKGLSGIQIIRKYQITGEAFPRIIGVLLEEEFITPTDMEKRMKNVQDLLEIDVRKGQRFAPKLSVLVSGRGYAFDRYELLDVSEYGLAVKGMACAVGEVTNITVRSDEFGGVVPFEFQAECRWTKKDVADGNPISGFEITTISVENLGRLCKFLEKNTISLAPGQIC